MSKVYVLGSLNLDTTYYVKELPTKGTTIMAKISERAAGGKGTNQAVAASFTGCETLLVGAVGNDANGQLMEETLKKHDVNTRWLTRVEQPTGTAVIFVDSEANNLIVVDSGANHYVPVCELPIQAGDWVIAQLETPIPAVREYFEMAKRMGANTMLNPSPSQ